MMYIAIAIVGAAIIWSGTMLAMMKGIKNTYHEMMDRFLELTNQEES